MHCPLSGVKRTSRFGVAMPVFESSSTKCGPAMPSSRAILVASHQFLVGHVVECAGITHLAPVDDEAAYFGFAHRALHCSRSLTRASQDLRMVSCYGKFRTVTERACTQSAESRRWRISRRDGWPAHKQQIMDAVLRNAKVQE